MWSKALSHRRMLLTVAALALPYVWYAATAGDDRLVRFFPDDGFYYLQPAFNFARTGRVTFDGVHATNGFHPLNFLMVAALATVTSKSGLVAAVFLVDALLMLAGLGIIAAALAGRITDRARSALLCLISLPMVTGFLLLSTGMEAALVVLTTACLVVLLDWAQVHRFASPRHNARLGLGMAAFVLARLDLAIALVPLVVMLARRAFARSDGVRERASPAAIALALAVPAVFVAAYCALNVYATGHPMPISGYVKALAVGESPSWTPSTGGSVTGWLIVLLPLASSLAALAYAASSRATAADGAVVLLNVGNLLFYAYLAFGVAQVFRWYFAFPLTCLALNLAFLTNEASRASAGRNVVARLAAFRLAPILAAFVLLGAIALNGSYLWMVGKREASTSFQLKRVSTLMTAHGGPGAVSGVQDAGVIGYFAAGRVINLDGLVNDYDYVDNYLRPRRVWDYLCREKVTHVLVRDGTLVNRDEVARGSYAVARSTMDPRLVFSKQDELFRYQIPGQFEVYYFRFRAGEPEPSATLSSSGAPSAACPAR